MKFLLHIVQNVMGFSRRIRDDHVSAFAAQSAYFILMSIIPILLLMLIVLSAGFMPRLCLEPSFWRVVLTTMCCEVVFVPGVWFFVLNGQERIFMRERVLSRIPIVGGMLKGKD